MDITWCDFWEDCANADECPRALTSDVIKEMKMFLPERPISHFLEKPDCWKIKNNKGE